MQISSRVLIVDDDEVAREVMRTILHAEGCAVTTAESGSRALDLLKTGAYHLVVLDINMPGVDGLEVLTRLKQGDTAADSSVIMTSARNDLETVMRCVDLGADSYLLKPVDPALFVERALGALRRYRARQWKQERERAAISA
jgi:DNA-binding response OmpR family regulator